MTRTVYRSALVVLCLYWTGIFILTHIPPVRPPVIEVNDKLQHLTAYALLTVLLRVVLGPRLRAHADWATLAIVLCYGAIDEWLQALVGRSCELFDWYADATGAAIGIVLCGITRAILARSRRGQPDRALAECSTE